MIVGNPASLERRAMAARARTVCDSSGVAASAGLQRPFKAHSARDSSELRRTPQRRSEEFESKCFLISYFFAFSKLITRYATMGVMHYK